MMFGVHKHLCMTINQAVKVSVYLLSGGSLGVRLNPHMSRYGKWAKQNGTFIDYHLRSSAYYKMNAYLISKQKIV